MTRARLALSLCSALLVALFALGCGPPPAPEDIDGLAHFFWQHHQDDDPAALADGIVKLHAALDADSIEGPSDGGLSGISAEEAALVGVDRPTGIASGLFILTLMDCPIDRVADIVSRPDQDAIHPDAYSTYQREFQADRDTFVDGAAPDLDWETTYSIDDLGYTAVVDAGIRRIPVLNDELSPFGETLVAHGHLPEPAVFDNPETSSSFTLDFQIETYHERSDGKTVHFFGLWRYLNTAFGDTSTSQVQSFMIQGFKDWDVEVDAACQ